MWTTSQSTGSARSGVTFASLSEANVDLDEDASPSVTLSTSQGGWSGGTTPGGRPLEENNQLAAPVAAKINQLLR